MITTTPCITYPVALLHLAWNMPSRTPKPRATMLGVAANIHPAQRVPRSCSHRRSHCTRAWLSPSRRAHWLVGNLRRRTHPARMGRDRRPDRSQPTAGGHDGLRGRAGACPAPAHPADAKGGVGESFRTHRPGRAGAHFCATFSDRRALKFLEQVLKPVQQLVCVKAGSILLRRVL